MKDGRTFLLLVGLAAGLPSMVLAEEVSVSLREAGRGTYEVEGSFLVQAPRSAAWAALTDYEHMEDFVSGVTSSRVVERREEGLLVEQRTVGKALIFSKRVSLWLKVRETPREEVSFEETSRRDFESYRGRWLLEEAPGGTRVAYRLEARPKFAAPRWLARSALRKSARGLLSEVREEILCRAMPWAGDHRDMPKPGRKPS